MAVRASAKRSDSARPSCLSPSKALSISEASIEELDALERRLGRIQVSDAGHGAAAGAAGDDGVNDVPAAECSAVGAT